MRSVAIIPSKMNPRLVCCFIALAAGAQEKSIAHFHHVHLNSTDPAAAIEFYTQRFDCEKASYKGQDAVWARRSWLLFNKVPTAAPFEVVSAIWHIGWGAEDMPATYRKQLDLGTHFQTPITDISGLANSPNFFLRLRGWSGARADRIEHFQEPSIRPPASVQRRSHCGGRMVRQQFRGGESADAPRRRGSTRDSRLRRRPRSRWTTSASSFSRWSTPGRLFPIYGRIARVSSLRKTAPSITSPSAWTISLQPKSACERTESRWMATGFLEGPDKIRIEVLAAESK